MMYIDPHTISPEEKARKKRRLLLEQVSFQSDIKKIEREKLTLKEELRRFEQDRARLDVDIANNKEKTREMDIRMDFLTEELRRLKKMLIELGS